MPLKNFVDRSLPVVDAEWLNTVDVHVNATPTSGEIEHDETDETYPAWSVGARLQESVSLFALIPVAERAAIRAGTSTYDISTIINAAFSVARRVFAGRGTYFHTKPINMTGRREAFTYSGSSLIGEGVSLTRFNSYTGNYPAIDTTGASSVTLSGFNIRSDNPPAGYTAADCASIGIMIRRGAVNDTCHESRIEDVRINMTSDMTRNAGTGTVGIINAGGEHSIGDRIQIYANLPFVEHNTLQFAVSSASNLPTIGVEYEEPYAGSPISCTVHEWRSMQLIAWDSFRAMWLQQSANTFFPNLYTSTRYLVDTTPSYAESFKLTDCVNIEIDCYQEASGLFGSTYRMDHAYLTLDGVNDTLDIIIRRGVADYGFALPGAASASINLLNAVYIGNSNIDCNYLLGIYDASGDNNGFTANPFAITGTPNRFANVTWTLDHSGSHSADVLGSLLPYGTNVESINFLSGDRYFGFDVGEFTPAPVGSVSAGAASGATLIGTYSKMGRHCYITMTCVWSGHSGSGDLSINGLPFTSDANYEQALTVQSDGLAIGAGLILTAKIPVGSTRVALGTINVTTGVYAPLALDTAVANLIISGTYKLG